MNKILSIILSVILIFSVLPAFAEEGSSPANDHDCFIEAQELLLGLGCEKAGTKKDNIITRDEWITLATNFSHYENVSKINLAGAGIHSDTNYYFLPESPIKVKDAIVMLVKLLGYQPGVEHSDVIYLSIASKLDIDDGIGVALSSDLTYEGAYILLANYLKANTADVSVTQNDVNIKTGDTNLLYEKFNIVELCGQVRESPSYSLDNQSGTEKGYVKIENKLCRNPRYNGDEYFGKQVRAYVKNYNSSSAEIVAMLLSGDSRVVVADSENCVSFENQSFLYSEENGKEKSIKISLSADVFCNGEPFDFKDSFIPQSGKITVIDNNIYGDGADVVIIDRTVDVKISSISGANNTIYSTDIPGTKLVIDDEVQLFEPGAEVYDFENLTTGDVLTVWYKNDNTVWKAVWNNYSFTDVISAVGDKGIEIAGKLYPFSKSRYHLFKNEIKPGENVTVLLNIYGEICDLKTTAPVDGIPGVMLALSNSKKGLSQKLSIKLYSASDGIIVYPVSEKVLINGKRYKTMDEIDGLFEKYAGTANEVQKFIIYKLNEDKTVVTSIDFSSEIPMDVNGESDVYLVKNIQDTDNGTGKYRRWSKLFGHSIIVEPATTTMFRIPKQSETGEVDDNPDLYTNTKFSGITSGTIYANCRVSAYSLDPNSKVAQYMVVEYDASDGSTETPKDGTQVAMVASVSVAMYNDEPTEVVVIHNNANPTGITLYGKNATYFSDRGVVAGDIVQVDYNTTTKIARAVRVLWKKDAENLANNTFAFGDEGGITDVRYCKVFKMWDGVADMFYENVDLSEVTTDDAMVFRTDMFQIFRYNERTKAVEIISGDEFIPYDIAGEEHCSRVIVSLRYRESISMFLID